MSRVPSAEKREWIAWLWIVGGTCILLGVSPKADRTTWFMENAPVIVATPCLIAYQGRIRLSRFTLRWLALHAFILMIGGYYTYAEVPFGHWMKEWFGFARNHYDRIGHFAQGFVPAFLVRELAIKFSPMKRGPWLAAFVVSACLAFSALYELIEWAAALALGQGADAFLGTQGDPWDTQTDMFMALVGALLSAVVLARWQDRSLKG